MTIAELKRQSLGRLKLSLSPERLQIAEETADEVLKPYVERDRKAKELKISMASYDFTSQSVLWLEREIRRRMAL